MANRKGVSVVAGCLTVLMLVLGLQMEGMSTTDALVDDDAARPDLIMIDVVDSQEQRDMPAARFLHDQHTKVLQERGKDCSACHKKGPQGETTYAFMQDQSQEEELDTAALKKLFHEGCISCHAEDAAAGREEVGPQVGECRSCHVEEPDYTVQHVESGMDNVLHYRHWDSKAIPDDAGQQTNCGSCHHQLDEQTDKLVYVKYEEEGCTTCHTESPSGDVKTDRVDAFHEQCVTCHVELQQAKAEEYGPIECAGCHGTEQTQEVARKNAELLEKLGELPRLPRKQPDATLLTVPAPEAADGEKTAPPQGAMPVAFDHKLHEQRTDSCADCHHQSMQSCSSCHTLAGTKEGGFVTLEEAMHDTASEQSCAGCHTQLQREPECAGCHAAMATGPMPPQSSCTSCHVDPRSLEQERQQTAEGAEDVEEAGGMQLVAAPAAAPLELPADPEARQKLAARLIAQRPDTQALLAEKDIPETVTIDALADEYKPSEMPHRKIVLKLVENMKGNSLAAVFHDSPLATCQGCHHNSPASATPPSCQSCHGEPFQESRPGRPGLKAAYHAQCMDCHEEMQLEKPAATDCTACHAKKDNG